MTDFNHLTIHIYKPCRHLTYTWPDLDIWFFTDWIYCFLFMILSIQLSFIFSLSYCYCIHCLYAQALPFSYTLIRSLLTTMDLHVQVLDMLYFSDQVFDELVASRGVWSFSLLILVFLSSFHSCFFTFLDSCISNSVFISVLYS